MAYYAQFLGQTRLLQQSSKVHELIIGYGTFGSEVELTSRFGMPTGIRSGGIALDIPMTKSVTADHNDRQAYLNYRLQASMIASGLEHQTPEQLYSTDPANPPQGISTMKALALANQQGQKIYTITQANLNETLPKIQTTSLVKGDIMSAVNAGQSVTVHERPVAISGWSGTGYMIVDAQTGSSAFIIGGVGNGGFMDVALHGLFPALLDIVSTPLKSFIYTMIDAMDDMITCINKGNYIAVVIFLVITTIIIAYLSWLITMAMTSGVGLMYIGLFAVTMELIFGEMNGSILKTC